MQNSSIPKKLLKGYMVICTLLAIYSVISGLISNFENINDWTFYFVMPVFLADNFLPYSRTLFALATVIVGVVLFSILAIYAFINQVYVILISSLGWIIPCFLYGLIYITEGDKNYVEDR